jgi:sugar/nucleoside kinase (ribokinase family)
MNSEVIVLGGRIYCDFIFSGLPSLPELGEEIFAQKLSVNIGGAANTAIALRRLGLSPRLIADLGTDFFSDFVYAALRREDLDRSLIQMRDFPAAAVTVAFPLGGERAFVSYIEPESLPPYDPQIIQGSPAQYLHVCGMSTACCQAHFVRAAKELGMNTLLDCACEHIDLGDPQIQTILASVDYLMPNIAEALAITGARNLYKATKVLAEFVPTIVVKMGADGALAYSNGQWVDAPALDIEPVDTTGAGDCFAAGFILGLLSGCTLKECLRYGNIAGGLSTLACGATCAPTLEQLMQHAADCDKAYA